MSGTTSNPLCFHSTACVEKMRGKKERKKGGGREGNKEENPEKVNAPESYIMINDSFYKC